jgi:hypothetical protein
LSGGLLVLERVDTGAATPKPSQASVTSPAANNPKKNASTTTTTSTPVVYNNNPGGQPERHCTDGNGKDNPQNKHCREASGA